MGFDKELPFLSGQSVIKRLKKIGFIAVRQKGSHIRLEKYDSTLQRTIKLTIPNHNQIKKRTFKRIILDVNLSVEEFNKIK